MKIVDHVCPKCGSQLRPMSDGLVHCTGWVFQPYTSGMGHKWSECSYTEPLPEHLRLERQGAQRLKGF